MFEETYYDGLSQANDEIENLKCKLQNSKEVSSSLLKEFERENNKINIWSPDSSVNDRKERKVSTVNPLSRPENSQKVVQHNASSSEGNKIDVIQLERQCKDLEDQLDQVKHQIVKIVTDKNDVSKENAVLKNYQIAFTSLTEQNLFLKQKLENNSKMLDTSLESTFKVPETDRTSPDGQEREKDQILVFKSSIEYETELNILVEKVKTLEEEKTVNRKKLEQLNSLEVKNKELVESLDMIKEEFESMEDYWGKKLNDERAFYEEQLKMSETQFKDLEERLKDYDDVLMKVTTDSNEVPQEDDDKLSTIEETFSMECQVFYLLQYIYICHLLFIY